MTHLDMTDRENPIKSDGKLLEITPIIQINGGSYTYALQTVVYQVPNWMLGFQEWHTIGYPRRIGFNEHAFIDGSSAASCAALTLEIRLLEDNGAMLPEGGRPALPPEILELLVHPGTKDRYVQ